MAAVQRVRLRENKNRVGPTPGRRRGSVDGYGYRDSVATSARSRGR
jgi:hypothetical protein